MLRTGPRGPLAHQLMRISKFILIVEFLVLLYPIVIGLLLGFGAMFSIVTGSIFSESSSIEIAKVVYRIFVLVFLMSGLRIFFGYLVAGYQGARMVRTLWWVVASFGAVSIVCLFIVAFFLLHDYYEDNLFSPMFAISFWGIFFVIPFIHLSAEAWLRK